MTREEAIEIIKREWDSQGACASCGWHAALYEYGDLTDSSAFDINENLKRLELSCLCEDGEGSGHRGVRIYYETTE